MNSQSYIAVAAGILLLVIAGGAFWLSSARVMPPVQKVELVIPDERLPR